MNLSKLRQMSVAGDMSVQALQYLLNCRGECEHLDYKEALNLKIDHVCAGFGRDVVAMRNVGGGYIVVGVKDKSWTCVGLDQHFEQDTKQLRDLVRKATGLDIEVDVVTSKIPIDKQSREFALILVRSTAKRTKLRSPSICRGGFHVKEDWGIRDGDIYFRKGDQTVRISSEELADLISNLIDSENNSPVEQEQVEPSPFAVESELYRLLPREHDLFVGRSRLLAETISAIEQDPRIWIVNLYGPGGVGKSAIATHLVYYYFRQRKFDVILQLSAKDTQLTNKGIVRLQPTLYSLENLLDNILFLYGFEEFVNESLEMRIDLTKELLSEKTVLLILDNMETVHDGRIMDFVRKLPPNSKAKVLLTSRQRSQAWEFPVHVNELDQAEVIEFLQIKSGEMNLDLALNANFQEIALKIHKASGGLPLAIQWILGEYNITQDLEAVVSRVRNPESPLLEFSFRNSWNVLSIDAREALSVLSIFEDAPTLHLWYTALDWSGEKLGHALEQLIEATFVSKIVNGSTGYETYVALPITLEFARNELSKMGSLETSARLRYQRYIQEMELVAAETDRSSNLFEQLGIIRGTEKRAVFMAKKAEVQKEALDYAEAEHLFQQALEIDPRSVYVLVQYGLFKLQLAQIGDAIRLIEQAKQYCNKNNGFFIHYSLSRVYDEERNRKKVELCLRKALEYDPEHPVALHQLGVVVSRLGRYDEAIKIFDDLISQENKRRSGPSATLVFAYRTKVINLRKANRNEEAEVVLGQALEQTRYWPHLTNYVYQLESLK